MKLNKRVVFSLFLGLLLFAFAIASAQDPARSNQKKHADCCRAADSCPMKDSMASGEAKDCCCGGESCDMKHEGAMKQDCCCQTDSCDMKSKQEHKQHSGDAVCCKAKQKTKESKTN